MTAPRPGPADLVITGTAQHEAWLRRDMPPVVLIDAGWGSDEAWRSLAAGLESIGAVPGWKLRALHTPGHTPGHPEHLRAARPTPLPR